MEAGAPTCLCCSAPLDIERDTCAYCGATTADQVAAETAARFLTAFALHRAASSERASAEPPPDEQAVRTEILLKLQREERRFQDARFEA